MTKHFIEIQNMHRLGSCQRDTTLLAAANACANCALKDTPVCVDCIDHALRGYGLVHRCPVVRH